MIGAAHVVRRLRPPAPGRTPVAGSRWPRSSSGWRARSFMARQPGRGPLGLTQCGIGRRPGRAGPLPRLRRRRAARCSWSTGSAAAPSTGWPSAPTSPKTPSAVAIDLAGFGQTPLFQRSAAVGANAELVHRFIEEVIGEPVILMGNSMGGHISILEAADHPDMGGSRWSSSTPRSRAMHVRRPEPAMLGVMAALSMPGLAEIVLDRRARLLGPERLVERDARARLRRPVAGRRRTSSRRTCSSRASAQQPRTPERPRLHPGVAIDRPPDGGSRDSGRASTQVEAPTLVIHGELDRLIPLAAARELVRRRPDWTLEILEGVGHVPMMETPDRFMERCQRVDGV